MQMAASLIQMITKLCDNVSHLDSDNAVLKLQVKEL
jgi:hypothetical protein